MTQSRNWRALLLASSIITGTGGYAGVAFAQDSADTASSAVEVEEVVVTARRREERLQEVPIAITAITPTTLERENIVDVIDVAKKAPGVMVSPGFGSSRAVPNFSIRGMSQQEQTLLSDPSVTVYYGDIVAARPQGLNQTLVDIAAVEVLKGPQGTLFGRNTTGGAIIIRPAKPTDEFEGFVGATVGSYSTYNFEGMINIPISDQVRLRIAGGSNNRDGFIKDVLTGDDINYIENWSLRIGLDVDISDRLNTYTVANFFNEDDGGQGAFIYNVNPNGSFNSAPARAARNYPLLQDMLAAQEARGAYRTASGTPMYTQVETWDVANTTTFQLTDNITVRNIIGWRSVRNDNFEDVDGLPIPLMEIERHIEQDQFSNEFQVFGEHGNLTWIVGAYYFREKGDDQGLSITGAVDPGVIQPGTVLAYPVWSNTWVGSTNISYALFAQGTFRLDSILDGLSLTAGIRQNWDERNASIMSRTNTACRFTVDHDDNPLTPEVNPGLANCRLNVSQDFSEPTWNISLDWKFAQDSLVYLAHRHGYRTGGFGARAATEQGLSRYFNPEIVDDIEIGFKRDWRFGDAFLRTNIAAFYAEYTDIQRLLTDPATIPVTTVAVNAAEATLKGFEFEFLFRPNQWLEFSGFYSRLDAEFDTFITPAGVDLSANPVSRAPEYQFSLSARVHLPTPDSFGRASFGGTYYKSADYWSNDDTNPAPWRETTHFPSWENVNLDFTVEQLFGRDLTFTAFVTNATDEVVMWPQINIITSLGHDARTWGPPRMYGAKLKYRF